MDRKIWFEFECRLCSFIVEFNTEAQDQIANKRLVKCQENLFWNCTSTQIELVMKIPLKIVLSNYFRLPVRGCVATDLMN